VTPEEHDVRLRSVDSIVHPATALLYSQLPPFVLQYRPMLRQSLEVQTEKLQNVQAESLTSLSKTPLGRHLAISWGRTTCLRNESKQVSKMQPEPAQEQLEHKRSTG